MKKKLLNDGLKNFVAQKICVWLKITDFYLKKYLTKNVCTLYVFMFTFSKRIKFIRF